jgi:signal transduction histidine kinase
MLVHELRSPLAAIQNALRVMMLARDANPVVEQSIGVTDRQITQLARLIGDLRDLTRATAGKLELRVDSLDLRTAIAHAVEACRPIMEQNRHELTVRLPQEPVPLSADPARLQQILVNLLTNSAKYTDAGGRIWLTAETTAVVRIQDNGLGIAPDLLPHIFDLFHQGSGLGSRGQEVLGIGLSLVKWLVELHGGRVAAQSDGPGKGSEFVVRLPATTAEVVKHATLTPAPQSLDEIAKAAPLPSGSAHPIA